MKNFKNSLNVELPNWYITGLVDAEGSFGVSISKNASRSLGYVINVSFEIALQASDKHILLKLKDYFMVGGIYKHGNDMYRYKVSSIKDIVTAIIPHFDKFPLVTQKRADFFLFKQIIFILNKGTLKLVDLQEVVNIKAVLNRGLSSPCDPADSNVVKQRGKELKLAFPNTIAYSRSQITKGELNPEWVRGFAEGEGCFFVTLANNLRLNSGVQVTLGFILTQHSRDINLLQEFNSFFGCGKISLRKTSLAGDFKVSGVKDIINIIIPFFEKYPFFGTKLISLKQLCLVVDIVKEKGHLTDEGLKKIRDIKSSTLFFKK
uniref:LAGLIDADG endonuclease n=1 Tax=Juglanconis juglandina TaxID=1940567 RepID=A0A291LJ72_9PEZI|nr:LAGLIDADG endonuclease [Juglanconis juglandina]